MKRFSERVGLSKINKQIQVNSMDEDLRICLWNLFYLFLLRNENDYERVKLNIIWKNFFKKPLNKTPVSFIPWVKFFEDYFTLSLWHDVYDLVEYTLSVIGENDSEDFIYSVNKTLEIEFAGYRLINKQITPIIDDVEVDAIEIAIENSNGFIGASKHLQSALALMSDKKNPDYRNSIKESISAVESICKVVSGNENATLGDALKLIEKKATIHKCFIDAFHKLYGYTCGKDGIRHAMIEDPNVDFDDAKFMLVTCSAFVNFLKSKSAAAK